MRLNSSAPMSLNRVPNTKAATSRGLPARSVDDSPGPRKSAPTSISGEVASNRNARGSVNVVVTNWGSVSTSCAPGVNVPVPTGLPLFVLVTAVPLKSEVSLVRSACAVLPVPPVAVRRIAVL